MAVYIIFTSVGGACTKGKHGNGATDCADSDQMALNAVHEGISFCLLYIPSKTLFEANMDMVSGTTGGAGFSISLNQVIPLHSVGM